MPDAHRQGLVLSSFVMGVGHHQAAWRHPLAPSNAAELTVEHFVDLAQISERGKFHAFFLADTLAINNGIAVNAHASFEPLVTLAAISQRTEHIGLVATASTAFYPPYHLARLFSTLDHASGGRFGWNIVTSASDREAQNFGQDRLLSHDDRYRDAEDHVEVVLDLLQDWAPDAVVRDVSTGDYVDLSRIDHEPIERGRFTIAGPLDLPRSPQGKPVLLQAGRSGTGVSFAARYADIVFSVLASQDEAAGFRHQLRTEAAAGGRSPDDVRLVPGIWPFIGSTEAEARALYDELEEHVTARQAATFLSFFTGLDLTEYDYDEKIPELPATGFEGQQGRYERLRGLVAEGHDTLRKLQRVFGASRGHQLVFGTPEQVAASIIEWFDAEAVDGFNIQAPILPHGLELFVDHVVPILQSAGVFRRDYPEGAATFREQLAT